MKPGYLLTIILASVLILSFAVALKSDVLQTDVYYKPSSYLSIREVDVKPLEVTSAQIELNVTAYIDHSGGKTKNATMLIRAISSDTGLLGTQVFSPVPETDSEKTLAVSQRLKVERNGGYDLKILVFDNDSIRDSGSVNVRGLNALTPQSKRSGVVLNNIDFTVSSLAAGKVSIKSDIYLENRGQEASENLKMILKAREASSNLLADKTGTETDAIASETTSVKSVQLVVPDDYNYMVVVELWRGDTLIKSWEKPVLLAPTKTVPRESMEKKVDLEVSKFVREGGVTGAVPEKGGMYYPAATPAPAYGAPKEPGFEVFGAVLALLVMFVLRRRL